MGIGLDLDQQAELLQILHNGLAALHGGHAGILAAHFVHGAVVVHHALHGQVVAHGNLKVVRVVGGGHLNCAGTEFLFDVFIAHHGNGAVADGQHDVLAHQVRIALVLRVDGHAGIAQHGFGTGGGDDHALAAVLGGIADVPQVGRLLLKFDFRVGKRGLALRAPVDDAVAAVDQALVIELDKHLQYRVGAALVHGESLTAPIAGRSQAAQLTLDASTVFRLPLPGTLEEALAAQILFGQTFLGHSLDDLDLGGDGRMVRAGQPKGIIPQHAVVAHEDIGHGVIHSVTHVQLAGDVGRGHHDAEGLGAFRLVFGRLEESFALPFFIQTAFHRLRVIGLGHIEFLFRHFNSSSVSLS